MAQPLASSWDTRKGVSCQPVGGNRTPQSLREYLRKPLGCPANQTKRDEDQCSFHRDKVQSESGRASSAPIVFIVISQIEEGETSIRVNGVP
ncbi:MAG: hypothetical protein A2900_03720 [Candidatus Chisholmbacteria bacterium RIFCSPLOWO2_01_FULL_50_28]|nr:MAG: hypothetical protein A2900_03720 [Candidatus Chisholmbacteria bacterium RIFCSPLOWO2_01_FULL_50_28]